VGIGPFAQRGLDEALGLAIGLWSVGPGEAMFEAEGGDGVTQGVGAIAGAVVGVNALSFDAVLLEKGQGGMEEGDGAVGGFVGEELGEGEAGMIVDGDVEVFPTGAADMIALARPSACPRLSPPPPRRSPVTRWPVRSMRASFLMSKWRRSPGRVRS
jgi:hypothetical protein